MVKHIVFWKLQEEANGNDKVTNAKLIKEKLEALNGEIDGLIKLEVGLNFLDSPSNFDVALYAELTSQEALTYYANHPKHKAVGVFVGEVVADRKAVDYEI